MRATGELCERTGMYRSRCGCSVYVLLADGMYFPPCETCGSEVRWITYGGESENEVPPQVVGGRQREAA